MLLRYNICGNRHPTKETLSGLIFYVKDNMIMKTVGANSNRCKCGKEYTGHSGTCIETWVNEHRHHVQLYQLEKLVMANHDTDLGHLYPKTFKHRDQPISKMTEICVHHKKMNMEDGFSLSRSWKSLIYSLKEVSSPPTS